MSSVSHRDEREIQTALPSSSFHRRAQIITSLVAAHQQKPTRLHCSSMQHIRSQWIAPFCEIESAEMFQNETACPPSNNAVMCAPFEKPPNALFSGVILGTVSNNFWNMAR